MDGRGRVIADYGSGGWGFESLAARKRNGWSAALWQSRWFASGGWTATKLRPRWRALPVQPRFMVDTVAPVAG
jgi:hypothetical protein